MRLPFIVALALAPGLALGQIHAMFNYETKSPESLKVLKTPVATGPRKEGSAIIDLDPNSKCLGTTVQDLPPPADLVFSDDGKKWNLSCMGTQAMVVGDAVAYKTLQTIKVAAKYPHGIAIHNGIDRILLTSTVRASDLGDAGEVISAVEASSGKVLGTYKVSKKPSPSGEAPVEILFVPGANPPVAYITNMYGGTLWTATWNPAKKDFDVAQVHDFAGQKAGVPLEMYFNAKADRMYVTTAKPGHLHIFDTSKPGQPKLLNSIATAEGAHHVAFTKDWHYAYVQNALLNLPGMSDGSVTIVDLKTEKVVGSVDTLKTAGFNPNSMVLLPQWNHPAGH